MMVEKIKDSYKAGVDIGGTKITASLSDKNGILVKVYQPTKLEGDYTTLPKQVDFLIGYICDKIGIKKEEIDSVGISTASPFERRGDYRVVISPNLCGGLHQCYGIFQLDFCAPNLYWSQKFSGVA